MKGGCIAISAKLGKKGSDELFAPDTAPFYIAYSVFLAFLAIMFVSWMAQDSSDAAKIPVKLKQDIYTNRILISNCFTYTDPITLRSYPMMLDPKKVTKEGAFDNCYNVVKESKAEAFKLKVQLSYLGDFELNTKNWDDMLNPEEKHSYMVLVKENSRIETQYAAIGVQNAETQ